MSWISHWLITAHVKELAWSEQAPPPIKEFKNAHTAR